MKFAFVLFILMAALTAAQAAPSQSVASLSLAPEVSTRQPAPTSIMLAEAEQAGTPLRRELPVATEISPATAEGPSSAAETTLVMLATGVVALLAVSRRRRQ